MWTLTGFADEISQDLTEQIALLNELGVRHIEFRSAWNTKVLDLTDEQLERAAHAIGVAKFFGTPYIRIFSFFIPEGDDPAQHREAVIDRTRALVRLAEAGGVTLLHENEKDIYGDVPDRVVDLLTSIDSPNYRAIFDPANYVQCGVRPFDEAYPKVREFTDYIHCKDASATEVDAEGLNLVLPCGEGDGQVREVIAALAESGYDGFFSLEPHLAEFDAFGGLSGPRLWTKAHAALTGLFTEQGISWQ